MNFHESLERAKDACSTVHALLGNGFSRACRDDIFAYATLFDRADFAALSPSARGAFDAIGTRDFEVVIEALRNAAALIPSYSPEGTVIASQMLADSQGLREVLVNAIAASHPEHPNEVAPERFAACREFLSHFTRIYSLNYDLLLYWALMNSDVGPPVSSDDGFRNDDAEPDCDYVVWDPTASNRSQTIFYVHGSLHLFDAGDQLVKYTWGRTGIRLIEQVRQALSEQKYPLFVSEGSSQEKLKKIRHHAYLARIERSFSELQGALFLYGVSCGESDTHVLNWIHRSKIKRLHVGLFGDPSSESNRAIKRRAEGIAARRSSYKPLAIEYFDAASAAVWG